MESKPTSGAPGTYRLTIRVKLLPAEPRPAQVQRRSNKGLLLGLVAAAAGLLGWIGLHLFKAEPVSSTPIPPPAQAKPAYLTAETRSPAVEAKPMSFVVTEVIPEVPRSARQTIRGTIRVSVRAIVGKDGAVLAATADDPGPSRYFERLAVEAAKKWMFAPASGEAQRIAVVRFSFTRTGTTARAKPLL